MTQCDDAWGTKADIQVRPTMCKCTIKQMTYPALSPWDHRHCERARQCQMHSSAGLQRWHSASPDHTPEDLIKAQRLVIDTD